MADLSSFVQRVGVHFCPTCAYGRLHPGLEANHSPCNPCCFFLLCTARSLVTLNPPLLATLSLRRTASLEPLASVPLPSSLMLSEGMSVTFPAYLAIFLGTLIPVAFLIILYIQAESRKAGEESVRGSSED